MRHFTIQLSSFQQRATAIGLAVALFLACSAPLYVWAQAQWNYHTEISMLSRQLAIRQALASQLPSWEAALAQLQKAPQWQKRLVPHREPGQPGPASSLIRRHGALVSQALTMSHDKNGAVEIVETIQATADIEDISHILFDLQHAGPIFVVRELTIAGAEGSSSHPLPNQLRLNLVIASYEAAQ